MINNRFLTLTSFKSLKLSEKQNRVTKATTSQRNGNNTYFIFG